MNLARTAAALLGATTLLMLSRAASAQECANPAPEWLFCDDFESNADQSGALGLWDDQGLHPPNLVVTSDPAVVHAGARSLEITAHKGADTGGGPTKWFTAVDTVYLRYFVRFSANYNHPHHLTFLGANKPGDMWASFGMAGCRPSGTNFFTTQAEPFSNGGMYPPPGAWGFYTYSVDMKCDPGASCQNYADPAQICADCAARGSPCSNGLECCWGADDIAAPAVVTPLTTWAPILT